MIKLRTLGECIIEINGERFAPDSDALFAAMLYLTAERGRQISRTSLAELLWPHLVPERGRHCLRQLVYRLRSFGASVEGGRETIVLPESLVAPTFSAAPSAERLVAERMAGTRVVGPYLPGYAPQHAPPFAEWLDRTRAAVEARVRRVVLEVAHAHKLRGEWGEVDALGREVLRIDPLNEEATLVVVEATAMIGAKSEAIAMLDRYTDELGPGSAELRLPAMVLRRRIAERFPSRRYAGPAERCFVGRAASIEILSTAVLRARNAEGSAMLLVGAAGIGKTRLVHELTKLAVMQGVRVVRVSIEEVDAERPMAAFVDAVPQLRALPGAIGASPESLGFLDRLTEPASVSTLSPLDAADPRWVAARIRQAVVDVVDAVTAEGTVLLLVEDVHWLDGASWATLNALLELVPSRRLFLLLTSRGPHPTAVTPLRCAERLPLHAVDALDDAASLALVRAIAADHGGSVTDDALRWCVEVGEGNPLFLRELAVHCLEGGATRVIPPSLQGLLDARIAKLHSTSKRVLQAAAILGDYATVDRLGRMLDLRAHELLGALEELAAATLVDTTMLSIAPRHALVAARVIELMPDAVRRWLHRRAALVLSEVEYPAGPADLLLSCAIHWKQGGDPARAIATLLEAATAIRRIGAGRDAVHLLETALSLQPTDEQQVELLRCLAGCLALDGQWEYTGRVIRELTSLPAATADGEAHATDMLLGLDAAFRCGADPWALLDRARDLTADRLFAPNIRLSAARRGLTIAANLGTETAQREIWASVETIAADPGIDQGLLQELRTIYEATFGNAARAIEYAEALQTRAESEVDPHRRLSWLSTAAEAYRSAGQLDRSGDAIELLLFEAQRAGSMHFQLRAAQRMAELCAELSLVDNAKDWLQRVEAWLKADQAEWYPQSLFETYARIALHEGRLDEAYSLALKCQAEVTSSPFPLPWHQRDSTTLLIEVLLRRDRTQIDSSLLRKLEQLHVLLRSRPHHDRTVATLAVALERAGRRSDATGLVAEYLANYRRTLRPWREPSIALGLGSVE